MVTKALLVHIEARPGREEDVAEFLHNGLDLVEQEPRTTSWFAIRTGFDTFGIFDTFPDEESREAHLAGRVAGALAARADELFVHPPVIEPVDVLAAKLPP